MMDTGNTLATEQVSKSLKSKLLNLKVVGDVEGFKISRIRNDHELLQRKVPTMKCARLHLQERSKLKIKVEAPVLNEKPKRYCQKHLVNPGHEEGQQHLDVYDSSTQDEDAADRDELKSDAEDLVLTVQTLKFEGSGADIEQVKRPRTSFKYKTIAGGNKHRMFVKQAVTENVDSEADRSSPMTYYYIDDYLKYLNSDKSRPSSGKSSIFKRGLSNNNEENKVSNTDAFFPKEKKRFLKFEPKIKSLSKKNIKTVMKENIVDVDETTDNTRITYQKSAKQRSLTISRNQSPETVHIIRVEVVCNNSSKSNLTDNNDIKRIDISPKLENYSVKNNHFASKYLLTNSIKALEENISGGSKVTLLCKTFKLADRSSKKFENINERRKHKIINVLKK